MSASSLDVGVDPPSDRMGVSMTSMNSPQSTTAGAGARRSDAATRVRWRIFALVLVLIVVNFVDRATLSIAMPLISEEFALSPSVQGYLLSSFFWVYLLFQIPGGWALDRFGPRRVLAGATVVWGMFTAVGGMATSALMLGATRLGLGAAESPVFPAGAKLNSTWMPKTERGRAATFLDAGGPFGAAVGGLIITGLIGAFGSWRAAFVITGALTVLLAVLVWVMVRDTPAQHPRVNAAERELIAGSPTARNPADEDESSSGKTDDVPGLGSYVRSRSMWGLLLGRLGWALTWWGLISWLPQFLVSDRGFSISTMALGLFIAYGAGVVGELLSGFLMDRFRSRSDRPNRVMRTLLGTSSLVTLAALAGVLNATSGVLVVVLLSVAIGFVSFGGLYWAFPAWLAPRQQVGRVGGAMNTASALGGILAPILMGYAVESSAGFAGAFILLIIFCLIYLVGSFAIDFQRPLAGRRSRSTDVPS